MKKGEMLWSTEQWCHNGKLHREDGPALVWVDGTEMWYLNGKRHRLDGPAVVYPDGTEMWFLDGVRVTKDQAMNPSKEDTTK